MDVTLIKKAAFQSLILMVSIIIISMTLSDRELSKGAVSDIEVQEEPNFENIVNVSDEVIENNIDKDATNDIIVNQDNTNLDSDLPLEITSIIDNDLKDKLSKKFLMIKKSHSGEMNIQIEDLYISKGIKITIINVSEHVLNNDMIGRINERELFVGVSLYSEIITEEIDEFGNYFERVISDYGNDYVHEITIENKYDVNSQRYVSEILLQMDDVYVPILHEDKDYYYIDLRNPDEVYDKILVIDAGHGGKHSGAISKNEHTYEKQINLAIVSYLKEFLDKENIKVYYTRLDDASVYLNPRVDLANDVNADFFISIHCNSSLSTSPKGTEILYYDNNFKGISAKKMAAIFLKELLNLNPFINRGLIKMKDDEIYILKKAIIPAVLIEVGYISNDSDLGYMIKSENQKKIALGIYNGIVKAYDELY